ncbi:MAG: putative sulfate exporter family transporter [Candidatus Hatepunaea meridiana]|nr:putative sulfate exporter family transporter [Candidatus Hatepunaea meridiana]
MKKPGKWSALWREEDWWAIWLGFVILIVGMLIFFPRAPQGMKEKIAKANTIMQSEAERAPFKTLKWYKANDDKKKVKANSQNFAKSIKSFLNKPHRWKSNPIDSFYMSADEAKAETEKNVEKYNTLAIKEHEAGGLAMLAEVSAAKADYQNEELNEETKRVIADWRKALSKKNSARKKTQAKPYNQIPPLIGLCIILALFLSIGMKFMGRPSTKFIIGFFFVFSIAILAYMAEQQSTMKELGIGYAAWAILFGLIISNTVGTPKWAISAVQVEYFIKIGLVLLGAEILFSKIVSIGIPGIFVAWVVTPIVLITTYVVGQKIIKMPSKTLNITISADMSVCGVSAAIATAAACRAKKEELTLAVGMSLVFTSIMMIVMPIVIKALGISQVLGGAWMGGTIDSTGAVAAAGAFLGEKALYVAATIKMIQNVLIGVIAFFVALYWCVKVEAVPGQRVSLWEIWYRFPKFVIGFIGASIVFSIIYALMGSDVGYVLVDHGVIRGLTKTLRGWFFCLAFVSIGLATDFRQLKHMFKGGKPLILYVFGQSFNLCLTLFIAYIMFYVIFPGITAKI